LNEKASNIRIYHTPWYIHGTGYQLICWYSVHGSSSCMHTGSVVRTLIAVSIW